MNKSARERIRRQNLSQKVPSKKGSLGVIFSPRNYRENAHSKSANFEGRHSGGHLLGRPLLFTCDTGLLVWGARLNPLAASPFDSLGSQKEVVADPMAQDSDKRSKMHRNWKNSCCRSTEELLFMITTGCTISNRSPGLLPLLLLAICAKSLPQL